MSRRKIKAEILSLLPQQDVDTILSIISKYQIKDLINPFFAAICRADEQVRWRGVSCFGAIIARLAKTDMEAARVIMRRFLWSLNDESGGIGWGAPETMAEAMIQSDRLRKEYLHMLVSYTQGDGPELCQDGNYLELPELQRGLLWALVRVAEKYPDDLRTFGFEDDLAAYLRSKDSEVRFLAVKCLHSLGLQTRFKLELDTVALEEQEVRFYDGGNFETWTIKTFLDQSSS